MSEKAITERQQYWLDHIRAAAAFEGSLVEYAKAEGLKVKDLYQWKTVFAHRGVIAGKVDKANAFVSVQARPTTSKAVLLMPNGIRFELSGSVNPQTMKSLLQAASSGDTPRR